MQSGFVSKKIALFDETQKIISDLGDTVNLAEEDLDLKNDWLINFEKAQKNISFWERQLLLKGKYDNSDAIVSIHAGAGGTEAQDWAAILFRMYFRFCEKQDWDLKILDESPGQEVGYKSISFQVKGDDVYGWLKHEAGVHRLVRISPFDADKARHTSFALVEVLPLMDDVANIEVKPEDLRIDTFMSGGNGGQSVNTTYSAVRLVHIPTGITVKCQNERSQTQNKETALKILKSKLFALEQEKISQEKKNLRGEFKSAEWGNQIRSYVLQPYQMVKDHRTDYERSDPDEVLDGDIMDFIEKHARKEAETSEYLS